MSKELEQVLKAYNQVEEFISEMPLSYKGYNTLGASEYISDRLNEIEEALYEYVELKKALTPPTADEVCKALSEWFGTQVFYEDEPFEERPNVFIKRGLFYYGKKRHDMNKQEYIHKSIIVIGSEDLMTFNSQLPPHIIEMIAKFFKGEIK